MRKEVTIFFRRDHSDISNMKLVLRDKAGLVLLEVKVNIDK
jgi:hypothetical protein